MTERMLKFHPLANAFPLLAGPELDALKNDIAKNGIQNKITLFQGMILDGRNRYRAGRKAHHTFTDDDFEDFTGTWEEAMKFVVSLNLMRRNLTESQRAYVAARLANVERPAEPAITAPTRAAIEASPGVSTTLSSHTSMSRKAAIGQDEAAVRLRVSRGSVQKARKVQQRGVPDLGRAVEVGDIRVTEAARIAELPVAEQQVIVGGGVTRIRRAANELLQSKRAKEEPAAQPAAPPAQPPTLLQRFLDVAHEFVIATRALIASDEQVPAEDTEIAGTAIRRALDDLSIRVEHQR